MSKPWDAVIVGGGLVGCSLAIALSGSGRRVLLLEGQAGPTQLPPSFDQRNLALARASLNSLQALGVMPLLQRAPAPISHIHVSRQGDFGAVRLAAAEVGESAFGAVVLASDLGAALQRRLHAATDIEVWAPASLQHAQRGDQGWRLQLARDGKDEVIESRLLVGADGTASAVRAALGIGCSRHDYGQTLFVCSLRSSLAVAGQAWERFTDSGPVALLPRNDGRFGAICGVDTAQASSVASLSDREYCEYLQQRFGWRAGRFLEVGTRVAYPLQRVCADALHTEDAVLIGNAAQTLHPIGAQGFNLGLRDALVLAECVADGIDALPARLARYADRRRADRDETLQFSHGLATLTALRGFAPHLLRSLGLLLLERNGGLKAPLAAGAMGFRGDLPKLAGRAR